MSRKNKMLRYSIGAVALVGAIVVIVACIRLVTLNERLAQLSRANVYGQLSERSISQLYNRFVELAQLVLSGDRIHYYVAKRNIDAETVGIYADLPLCGSVGYAGCKFRSRNVLQTLIVGGEQRGIAAFQDCAVLGEHRDDNFFLDAAVRYRVSWRYKSCQARMVKIAGDHRCFKVVIDLNNAISLPGVFDKPVTLEMYSVESRESSKSIVAVARPAEDRLELFGQRLFNVEQSPHAASVKWSPQIYVECELPLNGL